MNRNNSNVSSFRLSAEFDKRFTPQVSSFCDLCSFNYFSVFLKTFCNTYASMFDDSASEQATGM